MGFKFDYDELKKSIKFTQAVMIQNFKDKFEISDQKPTTPAEGGSKFRKGNEHTKVGSEENKYFWKGGN